jgi:hypothetical protein
MREKPAACKVCGAEATERRQLRCGHTEWVISHVGHWHREVRECGCPSWRSALGRRAAARRVRVEERARVEALTGKKQPGGRPGKERPITTPEMAMAAAEGLIAGQQAS